jgi:hypothetical protein
LYPNKYVIILEERRRRKEERKKKGGYFLNYNTTQKLACMGMHGQIGVFIGTRLCSEIFLFITV